MAALFEELAGKDVVVRGIYDVAGLRADADVMVWWHAATADALQEAYTRLRRTALGRHLDPVWSQMALHRPAEFNRSHIPAFLADEEPRRYVCVYPFVRSYEWYLLPDEERRDMLAEHGRWPAATRTSGPTPSPRSRSATTSGCSPSRPTSCTASSTSCATCGPRRARRHVREEVPFYTGVRKPIARARRRPRLTHRECARGRSSNVR